MSNKLKSRIALTVCALLIAVIAGVLLFTIHLQNLATPAPSGTTEEVVYDDDGYPEIDWDYWQGINPDIIGWISVPGTNISQPIVQARPENPQYYLTHDIYGNYNIYGAVYLDAGCLDTGLLSHNSVIYGHNMGWDQSMFGDFEHYLNTEYASAHSTIYLQTPDWKNKVEVSFVTNQHGSVANKRVTFEDETDFKNWYAKRLTESSVKLIDDINTRKTATTYTFCSCSYFNYENERTIIYASEPL